MGEWPKRCACGPVYPGMWTELRFDGFMSDGADGRLELRSCVTCKCTLSVEVEPTGLPWTMASELAHLFSVESDRVDGLEDPYAWPPKPRRMVTADERTEALRLASISDALQARVRAFRDRDEAASSSDAPEAA